MKAVICGGINLHSKDLSGVFFSGASGGVDIKYTSMQGILWRMKRMEATMAKGINRSVICIKDTGSKYFEEAIFIVNPGAMPPASEGEMADEAQKIVDRYIKKYCALPKRKKKGGAVAVIALALAITTIIAAYLLCSKLL